MGETHVSLNVDALKQAARRYTRKMKKGNGVGVPTRTKRSKGSTGPPCCLAGCSREGHLQPDLEASVFFAVFQQSLPEEETSLLCEDHHAEYHSPEYCLPCFVCGQEVAGEMVELDSGARSRLYKMALEANKEALLPEGFLDTELSVHMECHGMLETGVSLQEDTQAEGGCKEEVIDSKDGLIAPSIDGED